MALRLLSEKILGTCAGVYQRAVAKELVKSGLRYEDLLNEEEPHIAEAIKLAPPEVKIARNRRIKRAMDLDLKKKNFTDYAPDVDQETFKLEIWPTAQKILERDHEFLLLNSHKK